MIDQEMTARLSVSAVALEQEPLVLKMLLEATGSSQAGVCLYDERDYVRYVNAAFREAFFPQLVHEPTQFVDAIADAVRQLKPAFGLTD